MAHTDNSINAYGKTMKHDSTKNRNAGNNHDDEQIVIAGSLTLNPKNPKP